MTGETPRRRPARPPPPERQPDVVGTTAAAEADWAWEWPERVVHAPFEVRPWLDELLRREASDEEIVATLQERLLSGESDLHEAQKILNYVGGRPGGPAVLKRFVTQDIINRLAERA